MGKFSFDIEAFAKKAEIKAEKAIRLIALKCFVEIVSMTPVDTGRAKGSWTASVYTMPTVFGSKEDKSGSETISKATAIVNSWNGEGSTFLASNLDYMPKLEYGWSQQSPKGMVRITMAKFQGIVRDAVRSV